MVVAPKYASSEFPNDNPELHDGAVWVCLSPCAAPRALRRSPAVVEAPRVIEPPPPPPPPPAPSIDPFAELVAVLSRVLLDAGATRASAVTGALLAGESVAEAQMPPSAIPALTARGLARFEHGAIALTAGARETAAIWRRVLRGENVDLSSCESTLDSWCAELVASLLGTPGRQEALRRELRAKGVVAFGLLTEAA